VSKLERLIAELCPNGVEFKPLGEIGKFYSGLTGKTKADFNTGNARFITYKNVFENIEINTNILELVNISANERQNIVRHGDVIFTGSSENIEECGMSSTITFQTDEPIYLNSFCFGFRPIDNILIPEFSKYLFRSHSMRKQIIKTANGVTRFNVSKIKMEKITAPLPPLPIQHEIVRILDSFTNLTTKLITELETELTARKKQYSYYRDKVLTFGNEVKLIPLSEIAEIIRGSGLTKKDLRENGVGCIHYGQIYTRYGTFAHETISFVDDDFANTLKKVRHSDLIVAVTSENYDDVCKAVAWLGKDDIVTGGHTAIIRHKQNPKYLAYYFQTSNFAAQKRKIAHGTKVIEVTPSKLGKLLVPLPSLKEQARIVEILDRFDTLVHDIAIGLPAEIEARRKQYEYYRDKLLSFTEV